MPTVAVASSDGVTINEHFGRSRQFLIYRVADDGTYQQQEKREIVPSCSCGSPGKIHDDADHGHEATVAQLAGVDAVLALQIGPGAVESLQARGIKAFGVKGSIDRALTSYGKRHKLLDQALPGVSHGCGSGGGCGGGKGRGGCR